MVLELGILLLPQPPGWLELQVSVSMSAWITISHPASWKLDNLKDGDFFLKGKADTLLGDITVFMSWPVITVFSLLLFDHVNDVPY